MKLEKLVRNIESDDPAIGIGTAVAASGILASRLVIKIAKKSNLEDVRKEAAVQTKHKRMKKTVLVYRKPSGQFITSTTLKPRETENMGLRRLGQKFEKKLSL